MVKFADTPEEEKKEEEKKEEEKQEKKETPKVSFFTRIKWTVVVLACLVDMASLVALGPSVAVLQIEIFAKTTDCVELGDCEARVSKRNGLSGSIRSILSLAAAAPYGVVADRIGRRPLYVVACIRDLITLPWLLGNPSTILPFYGMNIIAGLLPSGSQMMTLMIVDLTSPGERFRVMSLFSLGNMGLALFANIVGSLVVARIGTQGILQAAVVVACIQVTTLFFFLPETSTRTRRAEAAADDHRRKTVRATKNLNLHRQTSANIAEVLFTSGSIDEDHKWEAKAFWLYLLCNMPDTIGGSQMQLNIIMLFGYTAADFGQLMSVMMGYQFFWLALGMQILKAVLPNEARIFQVLMVFTLVADFIFFTWQDTWCPFFSLLPATASELVPLTLQAYILDLTAEHRQGKILGFLVATDRLCDVIGPSVGGFFFSFGVETFGTTRWIFLAFFGILKPIALVMASFTLTKACMPEAVAERVQEKEDKAALIPDLLAGI